MSSCRYHTRIAARAGAIDFVPREDVFSAHEEKQERRRGEDPKRPVLDRLGSGGRRSFSLVGTRLRPGGEDLLPRHLRRMALGLGLFPGAFPDSLALCLSRGCRDRRSGPSSPVFLAPSTRERNAASEENRKHFAHGGRLGREAGFLLLCSLGFQLHPSRDRKTMGARDRAHEFGRTRGRGGLGLPNVDRVPGFDPGQLGGYVGPGGFAF
jgi:hypothetical protein